MPCSQSPFPVGAAISSFLFQDPWPSPGAHHKGCWLGKEDKCAAKVTGGKVGGETLTLPNDWIELFNVFTLFSLLLYIWNSRFWRFSSFPVVFPIIDKCFRIRSPVLPQTSPSCWLFFFFFKFSRTLSPLIFTQVRIYWLALLHLPLLCLRKSMTS